MATNIPPVADDQIIETSWGNQVRTEVSNLDTNKLPKAGGTITGSLVVNGSLSMKNPIYISPAGDFCLRMTGAAPYMDFYDKAGNRFCYIRGHSDRMALISDKSGISFSTTGAERGRWWGSNLLIGKAASDLNQSGVEICGGGSTTEGSVRSTLSTAGTMNFYCRHMAASDVHGNSFIRFTRSSVGTVIGNIYQVNQTGTAYATTSDHRLKEALGDVDDPVGRLQSLHVRHFRWNEDGSEQDGFFAHEVAEVVPDAVMGEKDAVLTEDDELGGRAGDIDPQSIDLSRLVPLLTAALQVALTRIDDLEGRLGTV